MGRWFGLKIHDTLTIMTAIEKRTVILLILFAVLGTFVRFYRARGGQIRFEVIPVSEVQGAHRKFESRRREMSQLEINRADAAQFEALPDVGPRLATAIVEHRNKNGKFARPEDMIKVSGFGIKRYNKLCARLVVDGKAGAPVDAEKAPSRSGSSKKKNPTPDLKLGTGKAQKSFSSLPAQPVDVNRASAHELDALPKIGPVLAQRIVEYRAEQGPFREKSDLLKVKGISPSVFKVIEAHITIVPE